MLPKCNIVQKSFRIGVNLNSDLESLSKKLGCSQNDLFNNALGSYLYEQHCLDTHRFYRFGFSDREVKMLIASLNIALEFMENHNDDTSEYESLKSRIIARKMDVDDYPF